MYYGRIQVGWRAGAGLITPTIGQGCRELWRGKAGTALIREPALSEAEELAPKKQGAGLGHPLEGY
jgi:hypothetical protein